jgi:hypothetical protein
MNRYKTAVIAVAATPIAVFATYIAWLIVPIIVADVVPAVVRTVVTR